MLRAITGDIISSIYKWDNIKTKDFRFFKFATYIIAIAFKLVLLISHNSTAQIRNEGITADDSMEHYIGSNACVKCHQNKYEDWSEKKMSHFVRYKSNTAETLPGNWGNSPIHKNSVFIIIGNKRKVAFVDNNWKVFPYKYH